MATHVSTTDVSTLEPPSQSVVRFVPYAFVRDARLPVARQDVDILEVWVYPETPHTALAELGRVSGALHPMTLDMAVLSTATQTAYNAQDGSAAQVAGEVEGEVGLSRPTQDILAVEDLFESEDDVSTIRTINALLTQAVREGASDIYIEPFRNAFVVRSRIDGTLRNVVCPKKALYGTLISRIKTMAQLDTIEKRLLQDGRITLRVDGRPVNVCVSTLSTGHGGRTALHLLDKEAGRFDLGKLDMGVGTLACFDHLINQSHGIVLVIGPAGSGKTTTLYAALSRLDATLTNIITVEDPIRYDLDGISQAQVNPKIDMMFAKTLRAILRQDPDVVVTGGIRDLETAQIAVQALLTGHLVLATLYTNDSASAVTHLIDMGIEPFLLSSSLFGVLAQWLVRRLCAHCRREEVLKLMSAEVEAVVDTSIANGVASATPIRKLVWHHIGCKRCSNSGYQGRTDVYELLTVTSEIQTMTHRQVAESEIKAFAIGQGMQTMHMDAQRWINTGATSLEEMLRVTRD